MIAYSDFKNAWDDMPARPNGYLSLNIDHPLVFQIGYQKNGVKSLVVMNTGVKDNIPSTAAVKVDFIQTSAEGYSLEFRLEKKEYEEQYLKMCWDIVQASELSSNPLNALIARYLSWQKMMNGARNKELSFELQKGLLGELLFFEELVEKHGKDYAINSWTGPDGSDQDYIFQNTWAEIKTVALAAEKVRISSIEQLTQESVGSLIIYVLEKSVPQSGICLVEKVKKLRKELDNDVILLDRFNTKLYKYGYKNADEKAYENNYFRLFEKREYFVDESFPCLTKRNVPIDIVECKYAISLAGIESFRRL